MSFAAAKPAFVAGLVASLIGHVLVGVLLHAVSPESQISEPEMPVEIDFDINEPPEAPDAETPTDDPDAPMDTDDSEPPADDPEAATEPVDDDRIPLTPEPDPEELAGAFAVDAGVPDAGVPDAGVPDAGVPDAVDAGVLDASVQVADTDSSIDAGTSDAGTSDAGTSDAGTSDAGTSDGAVVIAAAALDAGLDATAVAAVDPIDTRVPDVAEDVADVGSATSTADGAVAAAPVQVAIALPDPISTIAPITSPAAGPEASHSTAVAKHPSGGSGPPGERRKPSQANLLSYAPVGELVTAMIRFDRLRGTEWSKRAEAILAPMPDYRSLVGGRTVSVTSMFDTFVITSSNPRDVTATTLLGHISVTGAKIRSFIDHARSPVTWTATRGGPLGYRKRSPLVARGDKRVFLMPFADWVVLTQPRHLGSLTRPTGGPVKDIAAPPADGPVWLSRVRDIEREAGHAEGPALVFTVARLLPPVWDAPYIGELPTPDRITLALEVTEKGFFVRGTMLFADEKTASSFVAAATSAQRDFVDTHVGKALLSQIQAYNAMRGLSFAQNKAQVGFATSISVADGRAVMKFAAQMTRQFYGAPPKLKPNRPGAGPSAP